MPADHNEGRDNMKRQEIINEARTWIGTTWVHQASLKGVGADCVGLVRGVYREITGIDTIVALDYPATWHLFRKEERLYDEAKKHMTEIPTDEAKPGDVLMFGFRNLPAHHLGIMTENRTIIHSYYDIGKVVEQRFDDAWSNSIRYAFRMPGVVD